MKPRISDKELEYINIRFKSGETLKKISEDYDVGINVLYCMRAKRNFGGRRTTKNAVREHLEYCYDKGFLNESGRQTFELIKELT